MKITENIPIINNSEWKSERNYEFKNSNGDVVLEIIATEKEFPKIVNLQVKNYIGFNGKSLPDMKESLAGVKKLVENVMFDFPELRQLCANYDVKVLDDGANWLKKGLWVNGVHLLSILNYQDSDIFIDQPLNVKVSEIYLMVVFLEKYVKLEK